MYLTLVINVWLCWSSKKLLFYVLLFQLVIHKAPTFCSRKYIIFQPRVRTKSVLINLLCIVVQIFWNDRHDDGDEFYEQYYNIRAVVLHDRNF